MRKILFLFVNAMPIHSSDLIDIKTAILLHPIEYTLVLDSRPVRANKHRYEEVLFRMTLNNTYRMNSEIATQISMLCGAIGSK
jgi:hypothetical protein